jgi:hypothetical protein
MQTQLSENDEYAPSRYVQRRYKVSHMWIERRLKDDPTFPRPIYIAKRRYFHVPALLAWERSKAVVA